MTLLISGVLLWCFVHLMPSIAPPLREAMVRRLGDKGYRGMFALAIGIALFLIINGWRSTPETFVYVLPTWAGTATFVLMVVSFLLLGAAHHRTVIKRFVRHPMLAGVFLWSAGHLLSNGTTRALILFGSLGLWALIEMPLINRREGLRTKPEAPGFSEELKGVFISAAIFIIVLLLHPYFAGVAPYRS